MTSRPVLSMPLRQGLPRPWHTVPGKGGAAFPLALGLLFGGILQTHAQIPDEFNPNANGEVRCVAEQADGKILIGGSFTSVGGMPRNRLARLNADGSLDLGFNPNVDGTVVDCIALHGDGRIVIGGSFTKVAGTTRNSIARLREDGTLTSFNPSTVGVPVSCLAIDTFGYIWVGGTNRIVRLTTDGASNLNHAVNGGVRSIAVEHGGGAVVIGGEFTTLATSTQNRIARYTVNSSGTTATLNSNFRPNVTNAVECIAADRDGRILVGGQFTSIDGTTRNRIARLLPSGTVDPSFIPAPENGADGAIRSIAIQTNGKILVSGDFTALGGQAKNRVARLHPNGAVDSTFGPSSNGSVSGVQLLSDGKIALMGAFTSIGGSTRNRVVRLFNNDVPRQSLNVVSNNTIEWHRSGGLPELPNVVFEWWNGTAWVTYAKGVRTGDLWRATGATGLPASGLIRAAGGFSGSSRSGSSSFQMTEKTYGSGITLDPLDLGVGTAGSSVKVALSQPDGKTILAGSFPTVAGVTRNNLARLNANRTLDAGFNPNVTGPVSGTALQPDGKILIVGSFSAVGGTPRNRVARLNADGSLDAGYNPNIPGDVAAVALQTDGKALIGGSFVNFGGRNRIARLTTTGSNDTSFNPPLISNSSVTSLAVQRDGKILIAGSFTSIASDSSRKFVARLHADGSLDTGFNPSVNSTFGSPSVHLFLQPDGKILLGGDLTSVGGTLRNYLARIHPDGSLDGGFNPNPSATVRTIALQADGKILAGGDFTSIAGAARSHLARLNGNGTIDDFFSSFTNGTVNSIHVRPDGRILLGGEFTTVNGTARNRLACISNNAAGAQSLTTVGVSQIDWMRSGALPELQQVAFERWTGTNWTFLGNAETVAGGWRATGLTLPADGWIRARGTVPGGRDCGSAGLVLQIAPVLNDSVILAQALDTPGWTWTTGGSNPWATQTSITHDGIDAARSGPITHNQESWMQTIVTGPGTLDFRWRVSSQANSDFLGFYINGQLQSGSISGEVGWQQRAFELGPGSHVLHWLYFKNPSVSHGEDAGFVDQVAFTTPTRILSLSGDLAFGSVLVGQTTTRTLTISNTGNSVLNVANISYPAGFSGNWSGGSIAEGGSRNVTVTFTPTVEQSYGGNVAVASDATGGVSARAISGTGAPPIRTIEISGDLAFGNVPVGQIGTRTLTISNTGNSVLNVANISYPAGFSGSWSGGSIAVGGSRNVTVTFAPTVEQSYGGSVAVASDATGGVSARAISGWGGGGGDHGGGIATATPVAPNSTTAGVIETAGDNDYFRIHVAGPGILTIRTTGDTDTYGHLLDASGGELASDDDSGGDYNFQIVHAVTTGTYYVCVRHWSGDGTGAYQLVSSLVVLSPGALAPPTGVSAKATGPTKILVRWRRHPSHGSGVTYTVSQKTNGKSWRNLSQNNRNLHHTSSKLKRDARYSYRVTAFDRQTGRISKPSRAVSAKTKK